MDNNGNQQNPTPNTNLPPSPPSSNDYSQYIDPNYQNNRRKKILLMIIGAVVLLLGVIIAAVVLFSSSSSDQNNNAGQETNITETCEDEECLNEKFSLCQPAAYQASEAGTTVEYKILGVQEIGCLVNLKYIETEETELIGKEMTCDFDNEVNFQNAALLALTTPDDYECEGELTEYLF